MVFCWYDDGHIGVCCFFDVGYLFFFVSLLSYLEFCLHSVLTLRLLHWVS